jgi:predicted transcriptional regulator
VSSARRHRRHTAEAVLTDDAERLRALREAAIAGMAALDRGQYVEHADAPSLRAHLDALLDRALGDG